MMNKFRSPDDGSFKLVSESIKEIVDLVLSSQLLKEEESKCLESLTSQYQDDKNRNEKRVPNTCMWLLKHPKYLHWRQDSTSRLLWVSADPGCGKSVLSRALVDECLLESNTEATSVCYFFFKENDTSRQDGAKAMCAILHQLLIQKPSLLQHARRDYQPHGVHLRTMFSVLWNLLERAAADPEAGEIICVLDALDECSAIAREELIQQLSRFHSSRDESPTRLKFLATSRPYVNIERAFQSQIDDMTSISLRGEDESETISKEIDLVISVRVRQICSARRPPLDPKVQQTLISCLKKFENRTYLWLYLILDVVRKSLESTKFRLERLVNTLPRTVADAYEKILRRIDEEQAQEARSLLHIVLSAVNPLTLKEMQGALAINEKLEYGNQCQDFNNLELQSEEALRVKIRNLCGLFLSVIDSKVYLIHQTAKEFLISKNFNHGSASLAKPVLKIWKNSFVPAESNLIILKICLSLFFLHRSNKCYFIQYASKNWVFHFQRARIKVDESVLQSILDVCEPQSYMFQSWWQKNKDCLTIAGSNQYSTLTCLMVASWIGLEIVVKMLLKKKSVELNARDYYGRTALHSAATFGHSEVVKLLVEEDDIKLNLQDRNGWTALHSAATYGHLDVVQELVEKDGVGLNLQDTCGRTALFLAVADKEGQTNSLSSTPLRTNLEVLRLLLKKGADVNLGDSTGQTPLLIAEKMEHIIALVKADGIELNLKNRHNRTPLSAHRTCTNLALFISHMEPMS